MNWLRRMRRVAPRDAGADEPEEGTGPALIERSAPGIAALFADLQEDGSHAVLDLGPAAEPTFKLYGRFARRIHFADLLTAPIRGETWEAAMRALPAPSQQAFDLVLAWNLFDHVPPEVRSPLVKRLAKHTTSGARLYVVVDSSGEPTTQPLRFTLQGIDRVSQQAVGDPLPAWPQPLPAEVERLLEPFVVIHGFTLRLGYREYVAVRR